jgi:hypothetical protein
VAHQPLDLPHPGFEAPHVGQRVVHGVVDAPVGRQRIVLGEVADPTRGHDDDLSRVGLLAPAEQAQDRRLARPVLADEAGHPAGRERGGDGVEHQAVVEGFAGGVQRQLRGG